MDEGTARDLLARAYTAVSAEKVVRRALKEQRAEGLDPPTDVQYVAEADLKRYSDGFGIGLGCDILVYDEFPTMEECVDIFERHFTEALLSELEKLVAKWERKHPTAL